MLVKRAGSNEIEPLANPGLADGLITFLNSLPRTVTA